MKNTALITGASSGIGLELAKIHAEKDGDLILVARSQDKLKALANELQNKHGVKVVVIPQDLSQPDSAKLIFAKTQELKIDVDILINNAGFGGYGLFHERSLADEQSMMQVNMVSLTNLTHLYAQEMVTRKKGKILNVSSTASFIPGPFQAVYFATKAYVTSFTQAIANELSENNITATALCPGAVKTGFITAGNLEGLDVWKTAKSARSVADCGYKAMQKGQLVAFNELPLSFLLNWVTPFLPRKMLLKISRHMMEKK